MAKKSNDALAFESLEKVRGRVPYSNVQLWRMEQEGRFPKRIKIGPNRVAWLTREVDEWINARLEERGSQHD